MRFAKEAWPFVLPFAAATGVLAATGRRGLGAASALTGLGVLLFFRDPERRFEGDPGLAVAPADGLVTAVDTVEDPNVGEGRFRRVVTFLSAFDVHVQRTPVTGEVVRSTFFPGRKVAAFRADAGDVNECHLTVIRRRGEHADDLVGIRQIAGLMARRVVCYLAAGDEVRQGDHLGVIKFGSRVDLLVPEHYDILVSPGDRLRNGETPLARPTAVAGSGG